MTTEERISKQRQLIEEIGKNLEKEGFQPIAGRILGLLMVMDKEEYAFEEITEELRISKSSASNALRNLEIREYIEYFTVPGKRKRYFKIARKENENEIIRIINRKMQHHIGLLNNIIDLKADKNSANTVFFKKVINITSFFMDKIEAATTEYKTLK